MLRCSPWRSARPPRWPGTGLAPPARSGPPAWTWALAQLSHRQGSSRGLPDASVQRAHRCLTLGGTSLNAPSPSKHLCRLPPYSRLWRPRRTCARRQPTLPGSLGSQRLLTRPFPFSWLTHSGCQYCPELLSPGRFFPGPPAASLCSASPLSERDHGNNLPKLLHFLRLLSAQKHAVLAALPSCVKTPTHGDNSFPPTMPPASPP